MDMEATLVRWVVKVGSSTLVDDAGALRPGRLPALADQVSQVLDLGVRPALVVSGAVALGWPLLGAASEREPLGTRRAAAAALGQAQLTVALGEALSAVGLTMAQVLVTDLSPQVKQAEGPSAYFDRLIDHGAIPVLNGNDAAQLSEPRVPDNDTLAALLARAWRANLLVILTDQDGLLQADPSKVLSPPIVEFLPAVTPEVWAGVRGSRASRHGRGGMESKLLACGHAASFGIPSVIAPGHRPDTLRRIALGERVGTRIGSWPSERGA